MNQTNLAAHVARRWFMALVAAHVVVWTLLPTLTFPNAPLDVVENAVWGRDFAWGYPKHPPLLFWLLGLAPRGADWPMYAIAQLAIAIAMWATWRLACDILDPAAAFVAVLLAQCSLYFTWVGTELNHNVFLLPFFALATWFYHRALTEHAAKWWLALGAILGFGALAKYTMGLLAVSMALFMLYDSRARRSVRTSGPWLALLTASVIFLPHAIWIVRHEFVTFQYASMRAANHRGVDGHIVHPLVFAGHQVVHAGLPLLAAIPLLAAQRRRRELDERSRFDRRFLIAVVLGPAVIFCVASAVTGMNLVTAWGLPLWSALGVLYLHELRLTWNARTRRGVIGLALILGTLNVAIALGQTRLGPALTGRGDRRQFPGRELAADVEKIWMDRTGRPLTWVGGERWLAGNVVYYGPKAARLCSGDGLSVAYVDPILCSQKKVEAFRAQGGMLLWYADLEGTDLPDRLRAYFPNADVLRPLTKAWQTRATIPPVEIGMAIVPPRR